MNLILQALFGRDIKPTGYDAKFLQQQSQLLEQKKLEQKSGFDHLGRINPIQMTGNASVLWSGGKKETYTRDGYTMHGVAYSVINYITATSKQIPWLIWKLDAAGNKKKALENHALTNLLYRPNPKQSMAELSEELELHLLLTGNAYLWANRASDGRVLELWALPHSTEILGGGYMKDVTGYRVLRADGKYDEYAPKDVLHYKYLNPDDSKYGLSPIGAGYKIITAANAGLDVRVKQYQNNGPAGVLWVDEKADADGNTPLDASIMQGVKNKLQSFFNPRHRSFDIPFVEAKIGYTQLGLSPVDLQILKAADVDKNGICDLYRFPGHLLNGQNGSTFNNVNEASKSLYTKCVIPLKFQIRDGLNRFLMASFDDKLYIDLDLSGVAELQEDKKALAEMLEKTNFIKLKDKQAMLGVEVDEALDFYLFPAGMVRSDQMVVPAATTE